MECLFVYGTLHPERAPAELADIVGRFRALGPGSVAARVYDLGEYPGAVLDAAGPALRGEVFALPEGPEVLARLDAYEGFVAGRPEESLFLRERVSVAMANGGAVLAWMYVYAGVAPVGV